MIFKNGFSGFSECGIWEFWSSIKLREHRVGLETFTKKKKLFREFSVQLHV